MTNYYFSCTLLYQSYDFFTQIYNILDEKIFVKIFGCGCVPAVQTNMFNIDFNANDLRLIVYNILAVAITILSLFLSQKFESKKLKIIYVGIKIIKNYNIYMQEQLPYESAKPMYLVDDVDNKELLKEIVLETCKCLPNKK